MNPFQHWASRVCLSSFLLGFGVLSPGCKCSDDATPTDNTETPLGTAVSTTSSNTSAEAAQTAEPATLVGASIARSPNSKQLYVADETHSRLHVVSLPLARGSEATKSIQNVALPGPPAQLVVSHSRVWVTIRNPSVLWVADVDDTGGEVRLTETAQIPLPGDAWGLSLMTGLQRAVVTSAWTSQVSLINLEAERVLWSAQVAREPRGVVVSKDGRWALITHLVGAHLSRVAINDDPRKSSVSQVYLPAAPLRSPGRPLNASLGYSGALTADGSRYFAARHALGALGKNAWFGAMTVDALATKDFRPICPEKPPHQIENRSALAEQLISGGDTQFPGSGLSAVVQPRAMVYRSTTQTLLVAGEGSDNLAEFDALALDPTMALVRRYQVGSDYHPTFHLAKHCAAPSGLALSEDQNTVWVQCAGTNDIAEVSLLVADTPQTQQAKATPDVAARLAFAEDPLGSGGATGRKLFLNATDFPTSGGLGCAGCHPEGRDDGHVWHEASFVTEDGNTTNFVGGSENIPTGAHTKGYARRTPMLAGRVHADGPYGWHGESKNIVERELAGFGLHRWGGQPSVPKEENQTRARALFDFLRRGLVPPAEVSASLTDEQARGRELFVSKEVGCAECHPPDKGYTTRKLFPLPLTELAPGFDRDPNPAFKIPGLTFLKGRAPYFHDGSAKTIAQLIENNGNRMGRTASLSVADKRALIAFLETL